MVGLVKENMANRKKIVTWTGRQPEGKGKDDLSLGPAEAVEVRHREPRTPCSGRRRLVLWQVRSQG